jgi:hypothetical protein
MPAAIPPSSTYFRDALGLEHTIVGLYDLPSVDGIEGVIERRGCLFACFENWQQGESVHLSRARPGCPGSARWLCGAQAMPDETFLRLLVETEGLKPDSTSMLEFLAQQKPYPMHGPHLLIGPLAEDRYAWLRTVTLFCTPDQLGALVNAIFYLSPPEVRSPLLPSYGPGCLQIGGIFPDLEQSWAVISSTDIAMRIHLPPNLLSVSVTRPLFEGLCALDRTSLFGKPFWKRLRAKRLADGPADEM